MNDIAYIVVDAWWDKSEGGMWMYDLRERDGDGEQHAVPERVITPLTTHEANGTLDRVDHDVLELGKRVHAAMSHIEHMQGCATFDPMARDLAKLHQELGEINSIRCWIIGNLVGVRRCVNGGEA